MPNTINRNFRRALITGAGGSSGRYLIEYLRENYPQVAIHGLVRRKGSHKQLPNVTYHEADLLDSLSIIKVLRQTTPDVVFHLGANPDKGFEAPSAILQNNAVGTCNLLEAIRLDIFHPVIVLVSSSEVYGEVQPEDVPIKETCPFRPMSPYAVSKIACENLARVYSKAYGMDIIITRAFTYINYLRPDLFSSAFAKQIAEIEIGKRDILFHGNLESTRVMCDARDIMEAYWLAATKCRFGEAYNIGGEEAETVKEVLYSLLRLSSCKPIRMQQEHGLMRPADVTMQIPDCTKFKEETGWKPKYERRDSLLGLLEYWRAEVRKE